MEKLIYEFSEDTTYASLERLIYSYFYSYSWDTFEDYIDFHKIDLLDSIVWCKKQNLPNNACEYYILKQEIEEMLTRRDPLEIINILREGNENSVFQNKKELEDYYSDEKDEDKYTYMFQNFERIYYEFYHEDENFRLDLIETPIKKLKAMKF